MCPAWTLGDDCKLAPSQATWTTTPRVGRIEGEVQDLGEKTPIGNIEIRLVDLARRQRTDAMGTFRFDSVSEGRHIIATEGSVYQAHSDTLVLLPSTGMRAAMRLTTRRDVLAHCPIYRP
ncbi:MAG: hypothetical protein M3Z05_14865 [Gemmatimonadota bacterium]|nr:hypothetical protein [Gemmatimonadota bacterium]